MNYNYLQKIIFTMLLAVMGMSVQAADIMVSSASDISNANPSPGDRLVMSKSANWANQQITFEFNGTAANPITLIAEGNGEVILSGSANLKIGGQYLIVSGLTFLGCVGPDDLVKFRTGSDAEHCRLTNTLFIDNNPSDISTGYKWVSLYGEHNRVDHCWFEGKRHRGTTLVVWLPETPKANYHRIDHNYFTRPVYTSGNNEAETIRIGDSKTSLTDSYTTVEYNFFEECDGEIEVISNKSNHNIYRYNTFFNNAAILTLRHGHHCTVDGNFFFGNNASGSGGVRIIGVGHTVTNNYMQDLAGSGNLRAPIVLMGGVNGYDEFDATNRYVAAQENTVAFNTIVNCKQNIYIGSDKSSSSESYDPPFNNTIDNNIIYNGDDPALEFEYGEISSFSYSGNIYCGTSLGKSSTAGFTNVDPLLSTPSGFNPAHIGSNSPAINAATGNYSILEDFDGQPRTGTKDVGCDEYSTAAVVRSPILKTEVGPCWMNSSACENVVPTVDCNGDENGSATIDNCSVCSGGNTGITPNSTCEQDCNGDWNGSASVDQCGVCSGGSTGITVDACLECNDAQSSSDDGNVATSTRDNDLSTRWSANGSGQYIEYCLGSETTINTISIAFYKGNERTSTFDVLVSEDGTNWTTVLAGQVSSGSTLEKEDFTISESTVNYIRIVGYGNSSNTWNSLTEVSWSLEQVVTDCNGDVNGTASIDACGVCSGGNTGVIASSPSTWYEDSDNDGLGDPAVSVEDCNQPSGYVANSNDDCPNDATNTCNDPVDCNGDVNGTASIDACGVCSGGNTGITASSPTTWYEDADNDGFGDPAVSVEDCNQPSGYVANSNDDCPNDATNTCNDPVDCNGDVNGTASIDACGVCSGGNTGITGSSPTTWYEDADNDGFGDANSSVESCDLPVGYVEVAGDQCPNDPMKNDPMTCGCGVEEGTCNNNECDAPNYNASTAYDQAGTQVVYDLKLYQNKWYTQGNTPGDANGPWELIGFCGADPLDCSGSVEWNASTAYSTTGTLVVHNGEQYRNRWYSSGIEPGTHEVWEYLGPCSDSSMNNLKVMAVGSTIESNILIYPNPITQGRTINISSDESNITQIDVIDVLGSTKVSLNADSKGSLQVSTEGLLAGSYFVKVTLNDGGQTTLRLLVE